MIVPQRAPVRPRVYLPASHEIVPFEDEIAELLDQGTMGLVCLEGPAGAGKTFALQHLAALFPALTVRDSPMGASDGERSTQLVVCAAYELQRVATARCYHLAPWSTDEYVDYLLHVHPNQCRSVMQRLLATDDHLLMGGLPELCSVVLDVMANDEQVVEVRQAIRQHVQGFGLNDADVATLRNACLDEEMSGGRQQSSKPSIGDWPLVVRHRLVRTLLAADRVVNDLERGAKCTYLAVRLSLGLIREVARAVGTNDAARQQLERFIAKPIPRHAMVASILHHLGDGWAPTHPPVTLAGAYLSGARWPAISLEKTDLSNCDLSDADLQGANFNHGSANGACFRAADLRKARMTQFTGDNADFSRANLSNVHASKARFAMAEFRRADLSDAYLPEAIFQGANLRHACFTNAMLTKANLAHAKVRDADFTGADLRGACLAKVKLRLATLCDTRLARADLRQCDLEYVELPRADLEGANLDGALLTGTIFPQANLKGACLRNAGLAEIEWEYANLQGADLRGATFHLGSSRSGRVGSPIASEGSRTGFYTDDYDEQDFKAPEEIRKANLRGADLRGARIGDVDFYLVDLRDALYDPEHEKHFRRCGAILKDRQPG